MPINYILLHPHVWWQNHRFWMFLNGTGSRAPHFSTYSQEVWVPRVFPWCSMCVKAAFIVSIQLKNARITEDHHVLMPKASFPQGAAPSCFINHVATTVQYHIFSKQFKTWVVLWMIYIYIHISTHNTPLFLELSSPTGAPPSPPVPRIAWCCWMRRRSSSRCRRTHWGTRSREAQRPVVEA